MTVQFIFHSGSIFESSNDIALAHCVSADLRSSPKSLAHQFRRRFGGQSTLKVQLQVARASVQKAQKGIVPDVLVLPHSTRKCIYYLVTKQSCYEKPNYVSLEGALKEMAQHMKNHNIFSLAIPELSCGKNYLEWTGVEASIKTAFEHVFGDDIANVIIHVYKNDASEQNLVRGDKKSKKSKNLAARQLNKCSLVLCKKRKLFKREKREKKREIKLKRRTE